MTRDEKIALIQKQLNAVSDDGQVEDLEQWKINNEVAVRHALGVENPTYQKLDAVRFSPTAIVSGPGIDNTMTYVNARRRGVQKSAALLKAVIGELELAPGNESVERPATAGPQGTRIFIVHGHDDTRKLEIVELVRDLTDVKPTILSEYPSQGDTIIEKFERAAAESAFAIIIASADDIGGTKTTEESEQSPRARQNVIFELGYFIAKLGRSRVALMVELGVEVPSDAHGIVYIELDRNGGWKLPLAKELNSAGVAVDFTALAG